jgi:hypothetical protein
MQPPPVVDGRHQTNGLCISIFSPPAANDSHPFILLRRNRLVDSSNPNPSYFHYPTRIAIPAFAAVCSQFGWAPLLSPHNRPRQHIHHPSGRLAQRAVLAVVSFSSGRRDLAGHNLKRT